MSTFTRQIHLDDYESVYLDIKGRRLLLDSGAEGMTVAKLPAAPVVDRRKGYVMFRNATGKPVLQLHSKNRPVLVAIFSMFAPDLGDGPQLISVSGVPNVPEMSSR